MREYSTHIFAGDPLDRVDAARRDSAWVEAQIDAPTSRFLPFWSMKVLATNTAEPRLAWQDHDILTHLADGAEPVLLGFHEKVAHFALDVSGPVDPVGAFNLDQAIDFVEPRHIATRLPLSESGTMAHAKSFVDWHARHGFCARCGAHTRAQLGGKERICDACGTHHFPRTDPVAIMLIHHGSRCLLGRSSRHGTGAYSALAGFIDQGESIEEAVRREIMEEASIEVGEVCYHSSQPWPYPSSLMIGCIAEALSTSIEIDDQELDDVRWFTRDEILTGLEEPQKAEPAVSLPSRIAIAHHLLKAWANEDY